jgi:hypothetical protein
MHQSEAQLLLGKKSGYFVEPASLDFKLPPFFARGAVVTDLDMNGSPDLILPGEGFSAIRSSADSRSMGVRVLLNQKGRSWKEVKVCGTTQFFGDRVFASSATVKNSSRIYFLPKADRAGVLVLDRSDSGEWEVSHLLEGAYDYLWDAASVDVNGNGEDDLLFVGSVKEGKAWKSFIGVKQDRDRAGKILLSAPGRQAYRAVHFGHLNDDEAPDLVVAGGGGSLEIFVSAGRCSYSRGSFHFPQFKGCAGRMVQVADLNADGVDEIVASFATEPTGGRCASGGGITVLGSG